MPSNITDSKKKIIIMEEVNRNEAEVHVNAEVDLESPSTPGGLSRSIVDTEVVHLPFPGPDPAILATMNPNRRWLMLSQSKNAKDARDDMETLVKYLEFLNEPPGQQIFNVFEQLVLDWATVLEELTRAEGKFARDKELPGDPQTVIRAGMTLIKKFRNVVAKCKAMSDLAITLECIFAKAEGFNRLLSNDTKTEPNVSNENLKLSQYPLHCQQVKILEEVMTRMEALTAMINEKLTQAGIN